MTYIPNTKEPLKFKFLDNVEDELNPYYEGFLNPENKRVLDIFDIAVESVAHAFEDFDTMLNIADNISEDDGTDISEGITGADLDVLAKPEVIRYLKLGLLQFIELERNDLTIAILEDQNQEEDEKKYNQMVNDYKVLSKEEFISKYPSGKYYINEYDR